MSLAAQVLLALALGTGAGVFFGESVARVGVVGRGFVLLLQMAVLPFVSVSLMAGLGGLSPRGWRSLVRYGGSFLLLIWAVALLVVSVAPLAFPDWPAASYFSAALVEKRSEFDFLAMYIPANPFRALADGVVPAVVVFSVAFGIALMGSERKQPLLAALLAAQDALRRVTNGVLRLAPYGIFAIAAEAAGTLDPATFAGLQVYVALYVVLALLMALWVLPALAASFTPFRYSEVVGPARDAILTAFATGSLFIVLPMIADRAKTLLASRGADEESQRQVDVVVPIAFTLAGAGKLLGLLFVLYAGWQSGYPIAPSEYPALAATGLFASFAGSVVAIPFLLDLFRIPSDMFQLYLVVDSAIGGRFSALAGSMHGFSLSLLAGCGAAAWVTVDPRRLAAWAATTLAAVGLALFAVHDAFERFDNPYTGDRSFIQRSFLLPTAAWRDRDGRPDDPPGPVPRDTLERIRARGALRVGYSPDRLPYAFRNEAGELVGFDVEMAHALARDLNVRADFFRVDVASFAPLLDEGRIDIVMSGLALTPERLERMSFSRPVLDETLAFIVRDYRRHQFRSAGAVRALKNLHLAVPTTGNYANRIADYLPDAQLGLVESPRAFFRADEGVFDAMVFAAESGSAWTLIYPQFTVAVPHPDVLRVPVGYATARDDRRMAELVDAWVLIKRNDRTIDRLFSYWFEGVQPPARKQRWSVAADVLGWGRNGPAEEEAPDEPPATPKPTDVTP